MYKRFEDKLRGNPCPGPKRRGFKARTDTRMAGHNVQLGIKRFLVEAGPWEVGEGTRETGRNDKLVYFFTWPYR